MALCESEYFRYFHATWHVTAFIAIILTIYEINFMLKLP